MPVANGTHVNGVEANGTTHMNGTSSANSHEIPINNQYAYTPRKLRVITIGAGFSGLLMAHKFQHRFPEMQDYLEHTIYEGRKEMGGTWLVNSYPGVQCDVPSHIYVSNGQIDQSELLLMLIQAFPFDPNPNWSRFYSSGAEIQEYILRIAKKWNLDRDVKLNHWVRETRWMDDRGQWRVTIEHDGQRWDEYADVLLSGQGVLV
jgi:cation diffusion facilitator CzcD-associated flavoprotein CzcO